LKRFCATHGITYPHRERCPQCRDHRTEPWSPNRNISLQRKFRKSVLEHADNQCEYVDKYTGERCPETEDLQAHHLNPKSYEPEWGLALCRSHHRKVDAHVR
jgi:predicted restriction endonuclease